MQALAPFMAVDVACPSFGVQVTVVVFVMVFGSSAVNSLEPLSLISDRIVNLSNCLLTV